MELKTLITNILSENKLKGKYLNLSSDEIIRLIELTIDDL